MQSSELLLAGEKLLWKGAPEKGVKVGPRDLFMSLFGLFFFGFSIFWEIMAYNMGAPIYFMLFGIPFVAVGAYLVIGRFFCEAYARGRTTYVLTDRRALMKVELFGCSQKAVALHELQEVGFEENRDGTARLCSGATSQQAAAITSAPAGRHVSPSFEMPGRSISRSRRHA